ncbi:MAG: toxin co-regulated pilus biosynthesis Q family protein [Alphaproteobacteria bacterium]|nr:toxin co-regulated pilus biosynthesis Q family protein [Alphaproteobacteria bacterium]
MFRKILIAAMLATAAGYCFAATNLPQVVTSEVFYDTDTKTDEDTFVQQDSYADVYRAEPQNVSYVPPAPVDVPAWPLAGSDADVTVSCEAGVCSRSAQSDNIKIVSKIGSDLVVENNFNLGARAGDGWSGGANMMHGNQIPVGFDNDCARGSEMPLLHREVLEDDGGNVLAMSRSGRGACARYADGYDAYLARNGLVERTANGDIVTGAGVVTVDANGAVHISGVGNEDTLLVAGDTEISVDVSADAEPANTIKDQVRSWVVASGQTLRDVLQSWCDKEGWDLVWATSREYPIQASAVFKGRFVDVASAVVRNFERAIPVPYAKFYKGNRVLVISTTEE